MYASEIVMEAVQTALLRRGFAYPRSGERSDNSKTARRLAFDAMFTLTGITPTGIATLVGSSTSSAKPMVESMDAAYRTKDDRAKWIDEVRQIVETNIAGKFNP